jgi:MtN3 and saliva related transmembrane protein
MTEQIISYIGYAAATLTTLSFVPQAVKIIRTRDTDGISVEMYAAFTLGIFLWLTYGILKGDVPIIAANSVTLALASVILFLTIRYSSHKPNND